MFTAQDSANRIKEIAKVKGVLIKDLLDACGLSKNALSSMLSRGSWLSPGSLSKIADYLDVSVDYLIGRSDSPTPARDNLLKMAAQTDDPEELLALLDIVNKKLQERK